MKQLFSFILLFFLLLSTNLSGQETYYLTGKIIDSKTKEPLAFVNIVINGTNNGGTTDIDGRFRLRSGRKFQTINCTYVGYEPLLYSVAPGVENLILKMNRKEIDLSEVEILPGINPAHRIIRNAIDNRDINDPEKVQTFSYTSYDKTVFTVDADTTVKNDFSALVDTSAMQGMAGMSIEFTERRDTLKMDSSMTDSTTRQIEKLISQQYLFLMENITQRKFMAPDKSVNNVIATKMSGFKDPILVFLATQIQSFSFYKPYITIFQAEYVNPIGAGSLSKYFFKIEDTSYSGKDTVFIISFRPRKGTNFDGLKGVVAINTNRWAIQNVIAEPYPNTGGFTIRIHQMYEFIDNRQWFPVQLNTDVAFNNLRVGKYKAIGSGRSYIKDIVLNPDLVRREFHHLDVEVDKDATTRDETFWNQFRVDTLTAKDRRTYKVLDSVGEANNFDKMARNFQTLISGKIPWGPIDFDINRFINYNTYEGLILGLGIHTNDRLSNWFRIGGFYQYAFASSTSKYGGDFRFVLNRRNDITLNGSYFFDLVESGGTTFPSDNNTILGGNFRALLIKKLDLTESYKFSAGIRAMKYWLINIGFTNELKQSRSNDWATYVNDTTVLLSTQYHFSEITAGFKWAYKEKFIQTVKSKISLGTKYPVVWLQYTRGLKGFLGGEFDYNRIDLKVKKTFNIKFLGKLTFQVHAGYVDQPIPASNLFNGNGSYRMVTIYAPNSFATMRMNEFLSSGYGALYLYHDFGYLLFKGKKWFHPEFAIAQNIGFGWLEHKEHYAFMSDPPKEMNLGYYESGLLINNLVNLKLMNIGVGAFYRYGPYSMDNVGDNFAYKLSMFFPF